MDEVDQLVKDSIQTKILTPSNIERCERDGAAQRAAQRRERPDQESRLQGEIRELRDQLLRFLDAIGARNAPPSVMERIADLERQVATKEKLLAELGTDDVVDFGDRRLQQRLRSTLERFNELVGGDNIPQARAAIRKLLGDNVIWFESKPDGRYELSAETRVRPLFEGCSEVTGAGGGT